MVLVLEYTLIEQKYFTGVNSHQLPTIDRPNRSHILLTSCILWFIRSLDQLLPSYIDITVLQSSFTA